jgi:hypothetical protein
MLDILIFVLSDFWRTAGAIALLVAAGTCIPRSIVTVNHYHEQPDQ